MATTKKPKPIRLLIVDDDEALLEMMRQRFEHTSRIGSEPFAITPSNRNVDPIRLAWQRS